jgi:hypothetical protein
MRSQPQRPPLTLTIDNDKPKTILRHYPSYQDVTEALHTCPTCGAKRATSYMDMEYNSRCENGHVYHACFRHNNVVAGYGKRSKLNGNCACDSLKELPS